MTSSAYNGLNPVDYSTPPQERRPEGGVRNRGRVFAGKFGSRVPGFGFRVSGSRFQVSVEFWIPGPRFRGSGERFRISGVVGVRVPGFGFRVWRCGCSRPPPRIHPV